MRVTRTSTGRTGGYSNGRGRAGDSGYSGGTRGAAPRGRSSAGYPRANVPRENSYAREQRPASLQREQYPAYERPKAKSSHARKLPLRFIAILAGLAVVVVILAVVISSPRGKNTDINNPNQIAAGVKINGTDVSGQDVDKVSQQLKSDMLKKIDDISVALTYNGQTLATLSGADLGETDNVDDVMSKVSLLAHVGTADQRKADAEKYKQQGYVATVKITPDETKLKAKIAALSASFNQNGKNADVHFNWLVDFANPDQPTQDEIGKMFKITPEVQGQAVDVNTTAQNILDAIKDNPKSTVGLIVKPFVPQYTAADLQKCEHLLSVFSTSISSLSTKQRIANIKLALSKFNGLTLWPGQELSFNDTTGPRTASAGYQMAHVISGGTYVDDWGGGVCQASTTLYNAALYAGLTITDSGPHSIPSDYVKKFVGFDAMVDYGRSDLKFKNVYAGPSKNALALPVFIRAFVTAKNNVYVLFFGAPLPDGEKVDRETDVLSKGPLPIAVTQVDTTGTYAQYVEYTDETYVVNQPHADQVVDSYRLWDDQNGNVLNKELLRHDHYPEVEGLTVTGSQDRPLPSTAPSSTSGT